MSSVHPAPETFRLTIRVYYEDTDAGGVVYYANYLRYMERARTEWLASLGFDLASVERDLHITFVVHRVEIDYRLPARLGDEIDATVTLVELTRARMLVLQDVRRAGDVLTHSRVTLACLNKATFRPTRIPAALYGRLEGLI